MPRRSRYRLVTRSWSIDDCSVGMVTKLEVAVEGDCGSEYRYMNGPTRRASSTSICARVGDEGSGVCGPGDGGGGEARSRTMGMAQFRLVISPLLRCSADSVAFMTSS